MPADSPLLPASADPEKLAAESADHLRDRINVEFSPPDPASSLAEREMVLLMYVKHRIAALIEAERTSAAQREREALERAAQETWRRAQAEQATADEYTERGTQASAPYERAAHALRSAATAIRALKDSAP